MSMQTRSRHVATVAPFGVCVFLTCALLTCNSATAQVEAGASEIRKTLPEKPDLQAFRKTVAGVESSDGAYSATLPEQLLSLGLALQLEGRHEEAVTVFRRGSHLARINNGLHSEAQIPHLQKEITSHLALGQLAEADRNQARLFRVQQRSLANGQAHTEALLQQADWQRQAYNMGVGNKDANFGRLLNMWDLYRTALTSIVDEDGETSPRLLAPLNGMLQTQYLISGYLGDSNSNLLKSDSDPDARRSQNRFYSYYGKSYDTGRAVIRAIYDVEVELHGEKSLPVVQTRVMLADWMLWHEERKPAMETYTRAIGELAERNDAQVQVERLFGAPVALPDLDGVRPLPPEVGTAEGDILVEFGVNRRGKVVDLVRMNEEDDEDNMGSAATRFMRTLRRTLFRPRFADGEATITENIVKAYAIAH